MVQVGHPHVLLARIAAQTAPALAVLAVTLLGFAPAAMASAHAEAAAFCWLVLALFAINEGKDGSSFPFVDFSILY